MSEHVKREPDAARVPDAAEAGPRRVPLTPGARKVLEAAGRLFYERGIHAVGVDLIAAEAGVTKKTLYDRFGSKDQIVVEYLADRDERWRAFLAGYLERSRSPRSRALAVFDASRDWAERSLPRGCSMINAHAEITDPGHPAYAVITGQKTWMLELFTDLARPLAPRRAKSLGRSLMLLHEGGLVAYGMGIFPDAIEHARQDARALLRAAAPAD
ncbi:TetR/AcrR family transcriptional regulator [Streptomyces alboflavus]|uniref:TetR family transcriptional regulator n=1 Tax=Streptomyces alboflavus TaxID=67267 RepID=A0A1Z1W5T6_9ACTN|nr:TetR/AcrR family transcriptional regulator [Streptomyces alboflavus]ARX81776.1 TetR family transcriptional regulator [Streptomyces alboflavus]